MSRALLSIPSVSDSLSIGNSVFLLCGLNWSSKSERKFFIIEKTQGSWRFENPNREIGELKSANKAIADRCNRLERERDAAIQKQEESVSKDLFLQAISAATGRELKRND